MKKVIFALAAIALTACSPMLEGTGPPDNQPAPELSVADTALETVTVPATQGLIIAHNAYQGATAAVRAYAETGAMTPAQAQRLRVLNDQALAYLEKGGAGLSLAQRAAGVFNIVGEINGIIGRRN